MSNEKEINVTSYNYTKSDVVPEWVNKLDALKSEIRATLHSSSGKGKINDVKFCHPFHVPNTQK